MEGVEKGAADTGGDWRSLVSPEGRGRIVNKIMETLKKHVPVSMPEGLIELQKLVVRFEEKTYGAATSKSDYLQKIYLKMVSMENHFKANWPAPQIPHQELNFAQDPEEDSIVFGGNSSSSSESSDTKTPGRLTEAEDLQLVHPGMQDVAPEWIQPFLSQSLQNLLNTAFPEASSRAWWNNIDLSVRIQLSDQDAVQLNWNSQAVQPRVQPHVLQELQSDASQMGNIEIRGNLSPNLDRYSSKQKQVIKNVYVRKKKKTQTGGNIKTRLSNVMISRMLGKTRKRLKFAPLSIHLLRRSERIKMLTAGHRYRIPAQSSEEVPLIDDSNSASAPASEVDTPLQEPYPEISPSVIQSVALERCGVPPEEASMELLTAKEGDSSKEANDDVING